MATNLVSGDGVYRRPTPRDEDNNQENDDGGDDDKKEAEAKMPMGIQLIITVSMPESNHSELCCDYVPLSPALSSPSFLSPEEFSTPTTRVVGKSSSVAHVSSHSAVSSVDHHQSRFHDTMQKVETDNVV